jgi:hypothetical protein
MPAPTAPSAAPVAIPCTTRAQHQRPDAVRGGEYEHHDRLARAWRLMRHGATTDVVGEPPGDEQAAEQREARRSRRSRWWSRGEAPLGLVDRVRAA